MAGLTLQRCPFCGGLAEYAITNTRPVAWRRDQAGAPNVAVRCASEACGVMTPLRYQDRAAAASVWNRRHLP